MFQTEIKHNRWNKKKLTQEFNFHLILTAVRGICFAENLTEPNLNHWNRWAGKFENWYYCVGRKGSLAYISKYSYWNISIYVCRYLYTDSYIRSRALYYIIGNREHFRSTGHIPIQFQKPPVPIERPRVTYPTIQSTGRYKFNL